VVQGGGVVYYFDLPPTPEKVENFSSDFSKDFFFFSHPVPWVKGGYQGVGG
jgi:hypothetical protein